MRKVVLVNIFIASILIVSLPSGLMETFKNAGKYGWNYEETVVIGEHVETRSVQLLQEIFSIVILTLFASTLVVNTIIIRNSLSIHFTQNENLGITFPTTEPDYWHVEGDVKGGKLDVKLGEYIVRIPYDQIKNMFGDEEQ